MVFRPLRLLACLLVLAPALRAQELDQQPTAFTAWLNLHAATPRGLPIWLERLDTDTVRDPSDGSVQKTIYRLRFRHFPGLVDELMLRVYFDDLSGEQPIVSGWSEIGARTLAPITLGQGLGLRSSQTVRIPMAGVDYVEIEAPGTAPNLEGVLALSLQKVQTSQPLDFPVAPALADPFGNGEPAVSGSNDTLLFGRVKATLEPGVVSLAPENDNPGVAGFEFPLGKPPLIALLTFEILNADVSAPPQLSVNDQPAGEVSIVLPDLADPAYAGAVESKRPDTVYRYGGWLKCQRVIPGSLLVGGTNQIVVTSPDRSTPVAIRSVEVQLKYPPAEPLIP